MPPSNPREVLARQYIRGAGIEFGALHFPLKVLEGIVVKYADFAPLEKLQELNPDVTDIRSPDIVTDLESMRGIDSESQDFVIANHVLEHVEDPLRALKSVGRVLRSSGIAYLALPDKRFTFDRDRPITSLDHVIEDHERGPSGSLLEHYEEWCRWVDRLDGSEHAQKVSLMLKERANIHFHVWDYPAMCELFCYVARSPEFPLELEASILNGIEVIWILRKSSADCTRDNQETIGSGSAEKHIAATDDWYQEKRLNDPCPLCRSDKVHRARHDTVEPRSVFTCHNCGFVFVLPRVEQDFSGLPEYAYYGDWELLDLTSISGLYGDVVAARKQMGDAILTAGQAPSVLDAGCGAGHVLPHFRAHGWSVQGVDPWASVTEIGRKYYRVPIETSRIEEATSVATASHDVVLSVDVLQFIADPPAHLEACRRALKPRGMLYLTVPNFGSAESQREGWNWRLFLPDFYINYFTVETLTRLLAAASYRRIEIAQFGGPDGDGFLCATARRAAESSLSWSDLGDEAEDAELPPLDRTAVAPAKLSSEQRSWRDNGYLILPRFMPNELIDRYCEVRTQIKDPQGWPEGTPYLHVPEIRDLCCYAPLSVKLQHLLGEPMALHLNLTGWVSTERDWHQDDYLNPPTINSHYAAAWIALDDIRTDAGPFEFVPGSHRWPFIRQANVLSLLDLDPGDESWPWRSERLLTPFFETELERRCLVAERFLAQRGDVLIWHSRLLHRGSPPRRPGAERRSLIAHYSGINRRPDMGPARRHNAGGYYFLMGEERGSLHRSLSAIRQRLADLLNG
jgi:SAM-dependent methyltransferase